MPDLRSSDTDRPRTKWGDNLASFLTPFPSLMSSYSVRPATVRDAKAIARVHATTAQAAYQDLIAQDPSVGPTMEQRQAHWREAIEYSEPQVQVVLNGEEMVGFVGFDRSRDKGTPSTTGEI